MPERHLPLVTLVAVLAGCASPQPVVDPAELLREFQQRIEIVDSAYESRAVFSTQSVVLETDRSATEDLSSNDFLRGSIVKSDGARIFEVYAGLRHTGNWWNPQKAEFGRPRTTAKTTVVATNVDCSRPERCLYDEHIVFQVSEEELRRAMDDTRPQDLDRKLWRFSVDTRAGKSYRGGFRMREVFALIHLMDNYKPVPMVRRVPIDRL